jgi:AmiR/NasT family two-component response regulator
MVERAKGVLQVEQGISEAGAYEHLRRLSRKRRITLAALAEEVIRECRARDDAAEPPESGMAS